MEEHSRYAVGIDVGTSFVRCVVGHIDGTTGTPTVVGVGRAVSSGVRKGVVTNLTGPAQAIDDALGEAERMSGYQINAASLSINGAHILSTKTDGMIAVGAADHEITGDDLARIEEVATIGKVPANREVLELVPYSYRLDTQGNIKDPLGMTGTRLEINANVVSALVPYVQNLQKSADMVKVSTRSITPAVLAAAKSVLSETQMENGVALVDIGGATTSVAVYEDGDLQYLGVVPVGGNNITNDLAIGLKTDPEIAEEVKLKHATAIARKSEEGISIKRDKETVSFSSRDIDEIVEARLEEIFEEVQKQLKKAGRAGKLPNGIVLTGGTANIKGIAEFTKDQLGLAARVGKASGYGGVADDIELPEYATAIGLMLIDGEDGHAHTHDIEKGHGVAGTMKDASGLVSKLLGRFRA